MKEWKVNDVVIHKRDGVCRISELKEMNLTGEERMYYILIPVYDSDSKIYVPADQDSGTLREPLSVDEINEMIEGLPEQKSAWIENEKVRQKEYSHVLDQGTMGDVLRITSALTQKRASKIRAGRKFHASDERLLNDARRMLHGEFAFTLHIQPDDVPEYIETRLAGAKD